MAALIGYLPIVPLRTSTGRFHQKMYEFKQKHLQELPILRKLEFHMRPGVPSISDELDEIVQLLSLGDVEESYWHLPYPGSTAQTELREIAQKEMSEEEILEIRTYSLDLSIALMGE